MDTNENGLFRPSFYRKIKKEQVSLRGYNSLHKFLEGTLSYWSSQQWIPLLMVWTDQFGREWWTVGLTLVENGRQLASSSHRQRET